MTQKRRPPPFAVLALLALGSCRAVSPPVEAAAMPPPRTASGPLTASVRLDRTAVLAGGDGIVRAEVVIAAPERPASERSGQAVDVLVVLDRSGSMNGTKIARAREAVLELVAGLRPGDRFGVVAFASDVETVVPLTPYSPRLAGAWRAEIARIGATSGTAMSLGLDRAIEMLAAPGRGSARRVLLMSDGQANEGDATEEGLARRVRALASQDAVVTTIGFGLGFNERLLTQLADAGTGNFHFVEESGSLQGVFASEFGATRETVATEVAVRLSPGPGVTVADAAGYPLERDGDAVAFRPGTLFAGQERRIWVTYRVSTGGAGVRELGAVTVTARAASGPVRLTPASTQVVACVADRRSYVASIDRTAWEQSVTNEEYRAVQQEVARAVAEGRKDDAVRAIDAYVSAQVALNSDVASPVVADNVREASTLKVEVEAAFTGGDQAGKRNEMGKRTWSSAQDARRRGSKGP